MTDQSSLYGYFLDAGIGIAAPHVSLIAPLYLAGEGKTLALSTLEATAEAIVSEGLASADEPNAALANWRHSWPILAALLWDHASSSSGRGASHGHALKPGKP